MDLSPLFVSLKIASCSLVITFILGILVAYQMLFYKGKCKFIFESILNVAIVLPPTVVGFLLLLLLGRTGFLGAFLDKFDISIVFSWQAGVIVCIVISFPLMYRSVLSSFIHLDVSLFEVSQSLGATKWQILRYVALPLAWPGVLSGTILSFMRSLGEFGATLMIAGNIPGKTQTIPSAIYFYAVGGDMKTACYWVVSLLIFSFIFMLLVSFLNGTNE